MVFGEAGLEQSLLGGEFRNYIVESGGGKDIDPIVNLPESSRKLYIFRLSEFFVCYLSHKVI